MNKIDITRFHSGKRGYIKADSSKIAVDPEGRLQEIVQHIENAVAQLRFGQGEPRGLSFAEWRGARCSNTEANLVAVHALALDYDAKQFEALKDAADKLGYARLWVLGEDRAQTTNAVTLVIPFKASLTPAQYARIASCIATELGIYGMLEGALAATHMVNVHATTLTAFERGKVLDGEAYIKRTAKMFQGMDARRYERPAPPTPAVEVQVERPFYTTSDGLFEMPFTDADLIVMQAHQTIHGTTPDLTQYGRLIY
ncbi:hypothetical protein [Sphingomonas sp. BAUL-RG-20F-R05-02]|uniref:hypothetical protein n=1 Tax=Sphingomonas sp. BAUL-RG-20F-R05-02 TaxID=2914830 RepID=UPI001F59F301|nr:hypothetical protein [Sphingomonas sp. BAUL-RG-20F-R05-02]